MSGYSREDFDIPVKDYDFSSMKDISSLIDQMSEAGGFTATKLAFARDILRSSISKTSSEGVLNWISFQLVYAPLELGVLSRGVEEGSFNVVITTCGTLDHDIARSFENYFHGDFSLDDIALGEEGQTDLAT